MATNPQLTLVTVDAKPRFNDPAQRVFDHWVLMMGRNPRRCALGQVRRLALNAALAMYDEDMLLQAVEGMAADPLDDAAGDKMRDAMREIEWLMAREARIERWANKGLELRRQVARGDDGAAAAPLGDEMPQDPAEAAVRAQALRDFAARLRRGEL